MNSFQLNLKYARTKFLREMMAKTNKIGGPILKMNSMRRKPKISAMKEAVK